MYINSLFHWSPAANRESILQNGLKIYSDPVVHSSGSFPYLCFGTSPRGAWSLSGNMDWVSDVEQWDLWEITLADYDEVRILPFVGKRPEEVRLYTSLPADRCWLVGTRSCLCAKGISSYDYFPETRPDDAPSNPVEEAAPPREAIPSQAAQQAPRLPPHKYGARRGIL